MAYENFPSASTPQEVIAPRYNWMPLFAGVLFFALAFAIGYILWYKNKTLENIQVQLAQQQKAMAAANNPGQINELKKDLQEANQRYEMLKALDAQKDSINRLFVKQITEKKDSLILLLYKQGATQNDLAKAKKMIGSLKENIDGYKTNIEKVTGEKVVLIQQKQIIEQQNQVYQANLDSANAIIKQKADSIDIGATLAAVNFTILSVDEKSNGKEKITTIAKKVDKLRITFEIGDNHLAQSGVQELFVCVTDPSGSPIAVEALGSGKFTTRAGIEKLYTERLNFNYIQGAPHQIISFDWKQNTNFEPGDYKIEVYNNGFLIGEGVRHLKKGGGFLSSYIDFKFLNTNS